MQKFIGTRVFYLSIILLTCVLFLSDQIIKIKILDYLTDMQSEIFIPLGPFIDIILVWNTGISFGLFSDSLISGFMPIFTIFILICLFIFIYRHVRANGGGSLFISFAFITGGACGNMADRFYYGAVLDYIDVYYGKYHFPTFNLADAYIFCGVVLFLLLYKPAKSANIDANSNGS